MTFNNSNNYLSSLLCSRICAVLYWPPPVFTLFCLQLEAIGVYKHISFNSANCTAENPVFN